MDCQINCEEASEIYAQESGSQSINERACLSNDEIHSDLTAMVANGKNTYTNVTITNSSNVHLGNIVNINGPICLTQSATFINNRTIVNRYININETCRRKPLKVISRTHWLAQPPTAEYELLADPANFVIISHSATEEAYTQPQNVLLVRLIQQFHIESRCWDDIGYNFLIGADGNIYEGRVWNVVGAHTYGYNRFGIGICFIGCFTQKMPEEIAIQNAKRLIEFGVAMNYIDKNYKLVGHCQCSSTESPGRTFYENVKTWDHWACEISVDNPATCINS